MEKETRYAAIPRIKKGVAFSDPSYDGSVWCQYRREFEASDWLMKMESKRDQDDYIDFELYLGRPSVLSGLGTVEKGSGEFSVLHYAHHETTQTDLGIDTARIFIGSLENFEQFGEEASVYTAADGLFGEAWSFTCKGEKDPAGFLVMGAVDGGITDEEELFQTFVSSFDGREINRARYEQLADPDILENRLQFAKELRRAHVVDKPAKDGPEKGKGRPER